MAETGQAAGFRELVGTAARGRSDRQAPALAARPTSTTGSSPSARLERFYADWGVPDTRDGRFEMIGLHAALVMRRLRAEGRPGQELAQALFDMMFVDMDRSLREIGVGDLSVGKYVKSMAQTFFARGRALDGPVAAGDTAQVVAVLARNVYVTGTTPPDERRPGARALPDRSMGDPGAPARAASAGGGAGPSPARCATRSGLSVDLLRRLALASRARPEGSSVARDRRASPDVGPGPSQLFWRPWGSAWPTTRVLETVMRVDRIGAAGIGFDISAIGRGAPGPGAAPRARVAAAAGGSGHDRAARRRADDRLAAAAFGPSSSRSAS